VVIAIDGVAPRAKMNQQRTRRFLSAYVGGITDKIGEHLGCCGSDSECAIYMQHSGSTYMLQRTSCLVDTRHCRWCLTCLGHLPMHACWCSSKVCNVMTPQPCITMGLLFVVSQRLRCGVRWQLKLAGT
jgi:hypothetical protein